MTDSDHTSVLAAVEISKSYGGRRAVDGISLHVSPGEIVGLLGPNGAGKTTTLAILSTLLQPDSGEVLIGGEPAKLQRGRGRMLGLVPQSLALYPTLSAGQNVRHFARMQGLSRHEAGDASARVLEDVGLGSRARDPMYSLSGGMQRRLNLACGIVHRPAALLLDEPTVGVDLESRQQILTLVRRAADAGTGVIYSTHYMEEAERICDRVLLIDQGKLVAGGRVDELIALAGGRPRMELTCRGQLPEHWLGTLDGVRKLPASGGEGTVTLELASLAQVNAVLQYFKDAGVHVIDFNLHSPNLSDAFIALTGRTLRDHTRDAG